MLFSLSQGSFTNQCATIVSVVEPTPPGSVADPYHFDTDPNPGSEEFRHGSVVRLKFVTDPDPILIRIHKNSGKTAFFKKILMTFVLCYSKLVPEGDEPICIVVGAIAKGKDFTFSLYSIAVVKSWSRFFLGF